MKFISMLLALISLSALAQNKKNSFEIHPGKLHKGGSLTVEVQTINESSQSMEVKLSYSVKKRSLVPVPSEYLSGSMIENLPLTYADERGYLDLEVKGKEVLEDATLVYVGRVQIDNLTNGHQVKIIARNGKSETDVFYHPSLPGLGWGKLKLVLHTKIPTLRNYYLEASLKEN